MDNSGTVTGAGNSSGSELQKILNRIFRCRHRHQGHPMTLRGECFAVCLDCGQRVTYDFRGLRGESPAQPEVRDRQTAKVKEKKEKKAPEIRKHQAMPGAPRRPQTAITIPRPRRRGLSIWTREVAWLSALGMGLAGGFLYWTGQMPGSGDRTAAQPGEPSIPAGTENPAPGPIMDKQILERRDSDIPVSLTTTNPAALSNPSPHLDSKRSVVVLGRDAAAALAMSRHPGNLGRLVRSGSLFTVPGGTPIQILQRRRDVIQVKIRNGIMAQQQGWARASDVAP